MRLAPIEWSMSSVFMSRLAPRQALTEKLGRCARCMRLSAGLAVGSWLLLAVVVGANAGSLLMLVAAASVAIFTAWTVAHGVAYVARGPARAAGCRSCEERAKARRRELRWRRRWSLLRSRLRGTKPIAAPRRPAGCQNCSEKRALENDFDLADRLPAADHELRAVVESSPEYLSLLPRLAAREPVDTWRASMRNYFAYDLVPDSDGLSATALLVARWEDYALMSAMIITPDPDGGEARVFDLRAPGSVQTVGLGTDNART